MQFLNSRLDISLQSDWMKKYIDFNTEKTMNAANDFEKDIFKNDQFCLW